MAFCLVWFAPWFPSLLFSLYLQQANVFSFSVKAILPFSYQSSYAVVPPQCCSTSTVQFCLSCPGVPVISLLRVSSLSSPQVPFLEVGSRLSFPSSGGLGLILNVDHLQYF